MAKNTHILVEGYVIFLSKNELKIGIKKEKTMEKIPTMKSISECSEIVGLAKYHVRRLVLQGKVKYVRSGSKYLVNVDSLIEYLNNGETQTNTESENSNKIRKVGE